MKKRLLCLLTVMVLSLSATMNVCAAGVPTVKFDGSKTLTTELDGEAFDDTFKGMLPGESRTQSIQLENTFDKAVDFYMNVKVLKAFEDLEKAAGAAYSVKLAVTKGDATTVIYGTGDDAATIGGVDGKGLYSLNGSLNDSFLVATLAKGETAKIEFSIAIDGVSFNNNYNGADVKECVSQFEFYATYDDQEVVVPSQPESSVLDGVFGNTGDTTNLIFLGAIFLIAAAGIIVLVVLKRREHND